MGLAHPTDLDEWRRAVGPKSILRRASGRFRSPDLRSVQILRGSSDADLVVALDATHISVHTALLAPLSQLPLDRVVVVAAPDAWALLPEHRWQVREVRPTDVTAELRGMSAVIGSGHYTLIGSLVYAAACHHDVPYGVVQHGLLTPWTPPLPPGAHLLAWSAADAAYWTSGRRDVSSSVAGSALLNRATERRRDQDRFASAAVAASEKLLYLGQLHAAELPRRDLVAAAEQFCRQHGATYRPHPSERDRASRRQRARWLRSGIDVDLDPEQLSANRRPVVGVFSTGILEAAAAGVSAWVDMPDPPHWLTELWERYGMRRFGEEPTPMPDISPRAPAATAAWLRSPTTFPDVKGANRASCPEPSS